MVKVGLKQELKLKLGLNAYVVNLIDVLQLNSNELLEKLKEEKKDNPVLEILDTSYLPSLGSISIDETEEYLNTEEENILDDVKLTFFSMTKDELERKIGDFIFNNLDDRGFLLVKPEKIAYFFNTTVEKVEEVRRKIQLIEPYAIASLDQIDAMKFVATLRKAPEIVFKVLDNLQDIANYGEAYLAKKLSVGEEEIRKALQYIEDNLLHYAFRKVSSGSIRTKPDVIAYWEDGQWKIDVDISTPVVKISEKYLKLLEKADLEPEKKKYYMKLMKKAKALINVLEGRKRLLEEITKIVLDFHTDWLLGNSKIKEPLLIKEVARLLGVYSSTVSRAIKNKYVLVNGKLYSFKEFFSRNVSGYSREYIKDRIKQIIEEKKKKQEKYTDKEIKKILESEGINITVRAVTKYRNEMGIRKKRLKDE